MYWACTEHGGTHEDSWCWRERRDGRAFREACLLPPCSVSFLLALSVSFLLALCGSYSVPPPSLCFSAPAPLSSTHTLLPCSSAGYCAHDQEPSGQLGLVLSVCGHRSKFIEPPKLIEYLLRAAQSSAGFGGCLRPGHPFLAGLLGAQREGSGHEAVKAFLAEKLALLLRPRLISQLAGRRGGRAVGERRGSS